MSSSKTLIYACVFHNRGYIDLLKLLISSLNMNGNVSENTDFLIMYDTDFEGDILSSSFMIAGRPPKFFSMKKHSLFEAGCARLDIFMYPEIDNYDKILYLDTDILIANDINPLLVNNIDGNKLYALVEGLISDPYHGKYYWDLKGLDPNTEAFISGMLFFRNTPAMKKLFQDIKDHIHDDIVVKGNYIPGCLDQPFIVYNAVTQGKYDNILMCNYAGNFCGDDPAKHSSITILCHFCGSIGDSLSKHDRMSRYYNKHFIQSPTFEKDAITSQFEENRLSFESHLESLERIILSTGAILEGNSVYYHQSLNRFCELLPKQINLFWAGFTAKQRICEIGFNAGHSALLMLLGRPKTPMNFTIFDIGEHAYVKPTMKYIIHQFPHVLFDYTPGDSTQTIPSWIASHPLVEGTYDVVHVDGGHSYHCIINDMRNAAVLVRVGGILIVDDVYIGYINDTVNQYISSGHFREVNCLPTVGYTHRIIQKVI